MSLEINRSSAIGKGKVLSLGFQAMYIYTE